MGTANQVTRPAAFVGAPAAAIGLAATALWATHIPWLAGRPVLALSLVAAAGAVTECVLARCGARRLLRWLMCLAAVAAAGLVLDWLWLLPLDITTVVAFLAAATLVLAVESKTTVLRISTLVALAGVVGLGSVATAGAWSVDEPAPGTPAMVAGNGIVVSEDTHAFLIQQAAIILRNDGHTAVARFLDSADPTAPYVRTAAGEPTDRHESYLWRMQRGARDADRSLKPTMPDHFFNWWTHHGKGLIAGPSAATYAEQQYAIAVAAWRHGNRAKAMYHLGAATHLVDDACAPPHEFVLAPNHRAYEEAMLARQDRLAVDHGGIYRSDFQVHTGHGGPAWSSSHTRGWVDECAHRAADLIIDAMEPPPGRPDADDGALTETYTHFRHTQRLTAGYIAFFFQSVGGP